MLDKIEGRILDTIKTIDGKLIPGEFFIYWFMGFDGIEQFQVIQEDLHNLLINIVRRKDFPQEKLDEVKEVIHKVMGKRMPCG